MEHATLYLLRAAIGEYHRDYYFIIHSDSHIHMDIYRIYLHTSCEKPYK
jgi:hypothetical protein